MEFDYTVTTTKDFDSTVESVQKEIIKAGMRPILLPQFSSKANLGEKPKEIDQIIRNIIDKVR